MHMAPTYYHWLRTIIDIIITLFLLAVTTN